MVVFIFIIVKLFNTERHQLDIMIDVAVISGANSGLKHSGSIITVFLWFMKPFLELQALSIVGRFQAHSLYLLIHIESLFNEHVADIQQYYYMPLMVYNKPYGLTDVELLTC